MTAHLYWDRMWRTRLGRSGWVAPHPWVTDTIHRLRDRGVRDVLDLGCGVGRHTFLLAEEGFAVHAIDRSPTAVEFVRGEAADRRVALAADVADITSLPCPTGAFDFVLAFNVVYHADEDVLARVLEEVRRVLRPGGLYQATMLSKRNAQYGRGVEVAANTFVQPRAADDKVHPHLYADAADLVRLHQGFRLLDAFDAEQGEAGSYHWHCLFEVERATPWHRGSGHVGGWHA
ncbi:class I SAM-dependent methyltransferase [Lentzea sp.]|uniref:class I SAM-dependent methyltransferase n=1 Tax=Lentzea sp. TaxID=56099 RepID=UPI002CEDF02F|nr:class I SAM-dependent methyltransferase [Lentzea sp.]HUQ54810.1 class I SAM-dependent methyltransferase [Lentzea sp.]